MAKFNLEIEGFGLINEANIEINKINIVGGVNASGKSTASKLLYCYLKAMSLTRKEYALEAILPTINKYINYMAQPDPYCKNDLPDRFTTDDNFNDILSAYAEANKIFESLINSGFFQIPEEILYEMDSEIKRYIFIIFDKNETAYSSIVKSLFKYESLLDFEGNSSFYSDSFKSSVSYQPSNLFKDYDFIVERRFDLESKNFSFDDLDENFIYLTEGDYDFLSNVCYMDSISIFDLDFFMNSQRRNNGLYEYKQHIEDLLRQLKSKKDESDLSQESIDKITDVTNNITNIIGGTVYRKDFGSMYPFRSKRGYIFNPIDSDEKFNINLSSGIQQIGVIQILLSNYKLQPKSFLIIDEPEVNLHPEWQIKFAHILVLLAKELDINLYLNSHSPMFIEAISLYSKYYDLIDETNFYLTDESENGKFNFRKISPDDMGAVYENLTSPFDELDKIKAKILFKE